MNDLLSTMSFCLQDYTDALYGSDVRSSATEGSDSVYLNIEANKQMIRDSNGSLTVTDFNKVTIDYYTYISYTFIYDPIKNSLP